MEVRQFSFCARWSFMKSRMPATSTSCAGVAAAGAAGAAGATGAAVGAGAAGAAGAASSFFFLKMPPRMDPRMLIRLLLKGEALSASQSDSGSVKLARRREPPAKKQSPIRLICLKSRPIEGRQTCAQAASDSVTSIAQERR
ncbi:hypothetical protein D3C80_1423600 [compost metagenome]